MQKKSIINSIVVSSIFGPLGLFTISAIGAITIFITYGFFAILFSILTRSNIPAVVLWFFVPAISAAWAASITRAKNSNDGILSGKDEFEIGVKESLSKGFIAALIAIFFTFSIYAFFSLTGLSKYFSQPFEIVFLQILQIAFSIMLILFHYSEKKETNDYKV